MASKLSYLFKSPTGWFEYRRRVPQRLQSHFPKNKAGGPMTEWKQSLYTTNEAEAHRNWLAENEKYEAAKLSAEVSLGGPIAHKSYTVSAIAKQLTVQEGIHPDQGPRLDVSATLEDIAAFPKRLEEWRNRLAEKSELMLEIIADNSVDEDQRQKDYDEGRWATDGYQTPFKAVSPDHPIAAAYAIATGTSYVPSHTTWRDAVELYIKINKQEKKREAVKEIKWEKSTRLLLEKFAKHNGGTERVNDFETVAFGL